MKVIRRNFLVTLGSSLGLFSLFKYRSKDSKRKYQITYICKIKNPENVDFFAERNKWEHKEKVIELCERYSKSGKLLSSAYSEDGQNLRKWTYIFNNRFSYEEWSQEIFVKGYFKHDKIQSQFEYTIEGKYV